MAADLSGDGFEAAAQLVDLDGQTGQGGGVLAVGAVFLDDGAQVGPPVEGGAAWRRGSRPRRRPGAVRRAACPRRPAAPGG